MRGHVRKRGKTWSIVYDELAAEDGKRRQRWVSGFRTKTEAQDALTKTLNAISTHEYATPERLTFREFCEQRWLPHAETVRRRSTLDAYRRQLRVHIYPAIGGVPVQKLDASRLDRLYRDLLAGDEKRGQKPLAPASVGLVASIISASLSYARSRRNRCSQRRRGRAGADSPAAPNERLDGSRASNVPRSREGRPAVRALAVPGRHGCSPR